MPLYNDCGGCTLQHWSLAAQQQHKEAGLLGLLQPLAPNLALASPLTSSAGGYRHRLRLVVLRKQYKCYALGLRRWTCFPTPGTARRSLCSSASYRWSGLLLVLAILYPPCKAMADLKSRRKDWWLSYL